MSSFPPSQLRILCAALMFVTFQTLKAQNKKTDSLLNILKAGKQDTNRVNALNNLAGIVSAANPDTAVIIAHEAITLSQKLKWKKGEAMAEGRLGLFIKNYFDPKDAIPHFNNAIRILDEMMSSPEEKIACKLKGKVLSNMGNVYSDKSEYYQALNCYFRALKSSEMAGDRQAMGKTMGNIGIIYKMQSNYKKALEYYKKSLKIAEEFNDKRSIGITSGNIGGVYYNQSDFPKALEFYFKDLKIAEELGDKEGVGIALGNIANVYHLQGERKKALEYFFRGLKNSEEAGDKIQIGLTLANIAGVYADEKEMSKALEYFFKGVKISEEAGDKQQVGRALCSIGATYAYRGDSSLKANNNNYAKQTAFPKALEFYLKGLKISEEVGQKQQVGTVMGNIGSLYNLLGEYSKAEDYLKRALIISEEVGAQYDQKSHHEMLFNLYEKTNRPGSALEHYRKFIALRDSIFSNENAKRSLQVEMEHDYQKKQAVEKAEYRKDMEKQQALASEESRKQRIIIGSVVIVLLLVVVFALFVFNSLKTTRQQKALIEIKNKETEEQKKIIEEKQKETLDSIYYAKRIQIAFMSSEKYIEKNLERLVKRR